jgi:RNA polymerase sigma-70 factor (ECF subfamily)
MADTSCVVDPREQFEGIYREHAPAVRAFARRYAQVEEADDVVADVFLVVWRRLDAVPEHPRGWLLSVARKTLANRRRGQSRALALNEKLIGEQTVKTGHGDDGSGNDGTVFAALRGLPETDREVLLLVAWDDLSPRDAARVLGVTKGTFAVRLYRARRRLSRAIQAGDLVERGGIQQPPTVGSLR